MTLPAEHSSSHTRNAPTVPLPGSPPFGGGRPVGPRGPSTATAPLVATGGVPPAGPVPHLTDGLRALGQYQDSGFTDRRYVVRRGDGQVLMLSRLLYLVVTSIDGVRTIETISHRVSGRFGQEVTEDNIVHLISNRLTPLGVTVPLGELPRACDKAPSSDLLLALRGHRVLLDEARVARVAAALSWLHRPPMVGLVLAGTAAVDVWLFAVHGAMTPLLRVLEQPVWMLAVFLLTVLSLLFHEFGHASACRYSGAVPGKIGFGIYLIWPALYTDVTDVYRIGRRGRLRTGLGGIYFNAVFILALTLGYLLTGQAFFLAAVYLAHFEVLEQLMPALRLDGYYILGDLAGVPDLFGKVKPILRSLLPGPPPPGVADLKRSARIVVASWVLTMIPLLLVEVCYVLWNLPRLVATASRSLTEQVMGTVDAFGAGHPAAGAVGVVGALMIACPMAGGVYLGGQALARLTRAAARVTRGRPALRLAAAAVVCASACVLGAAWWHGMTPAPLPPAAPVAPALQPGLPRVRIAKSPAAVQPRTPPVRRPGRHPFPAGPTPVPGTGVIRPTAVAPSSSRATARSVPARPSASPRSATSSPPASRTAPAPVPSTQPDVTPSSPPSPSVPGPGTASPSTSAIPSPSPSTT
ncbi:M50 family metallopeptidase [Streptomyces bauhiniae]|uniref:M50 family metallopeptidase n=1 Tax=Streptomyces bauhiniae TaxID=2340725 RepID=UPI003455651A